MSRPSLVLLLLLAGCGSDALPRSAADRARADSAAPTPAPSPAGEPRFSIGTTTRLEVAPGTVDPGAQFVVRFEIRNDAPDTLTLTQTCDAPARVALREASAPAGAPALETTTCAEKITTHAVPPNASVVLQFPTRAAAKSRPLEPGLYVLEATPTITEANGRPFSISPVTAELRVR